MCFLILSTVKSHSFAFVFVFKPSERRRVLLQPQLSSRPGGCGRIRAPICCVPLQKGQARQAGAQATSGRCQGPSGSSQGMGFPHTSSSCSPLSLLRSEVKTHTRRKTPPATTSARPASQARCEATTRPRRRQLGPHQAAPCHSPWKSPRPALRTAPGAFCGVSLSPHPHPSILSWARPPPAPYGPAMPD